MTSSTPLTVTASYSNVNATFGITVNPVPPALTSVAVNPSTVVSGQSSTGTVNLSAAAGPGGAVVSLSSSNSAAASVPVSVTVPQGSSSATFSVTTGTVITATSVTLTASYASATATVGISVNPPAPPTAVSVAPSSGSGSAQTFAFTFADPNGATDIASIQIDITAALASTASCYFDYAPAANKIYLANDAAVWLPGITLGSSGTLENSQCMLNVGASSVSLSGNTLTLNLALSFTTAFAGAKGVYMEVQNATLDSGWVQRGTWTVTSGSPSPDYSLSMTPASQSVAPGGNTSYTVTVTGNNGFSGTVNLGVSGLPSGVTGSFNPTSVAGSGSSTLTIDVGAAVASGSYTATVTGTSGALVHTTSSGLTITGGGSSGSFTSAAITSPANDSTLTSSTEMFQWSAGTGTTGAYWLRVGTTGVGSYDISAALNAGTSAAVSGLPTNGGTVYVRLYSQNANSGQWVSNDYTYTAATGGGGSGGSFTPAAITSPSNGSTLTSSTVTFQWNAGTGTTGGYWLRVGTTGVGSYDISAALNAGTSATVSGLPSNGGTVYVRLYSQNANSGQWVSNDYTYTAGTGGGGSGGSFTSAAITSPANDSTLTSSTVTFQWNAGTGTTGGYWLRVGTTGVGSYDISAALNAGTSAAVSGIPTNGGTVYVRLYSQNANSGQWVSNDYTYTAASGGGGSGGSFTPAAITSPANDSTLTSSTVTFQWNAGTGTTGGYWLRVGTTGVGSYDISAALYGGTSAMVSGLPSNGATLYVRLYSQNANSGDWSYYDYTYTAP